MYTTGLRRCAAESASSRPVQRVPAGRSLHAHVGSRASFARSCASSGDDVGDSQRGERALRERPISRAARPFSRWRSSPSSSTGTRSWSRAAIASPSARSRRPRRCTSPTFTRRCATRTRRKAPTKRASPADSSVARSFAAPRTTCGDGKTAASARPHVLIANSTYTRERIRRYYQRDAQVIEPPIETHRFERAARARGVGRDAGALSPGVGAGSEQARRSRAARVPRTTRAPRGRGRGARARSSRASRRPEHDASARASTRASSRRCSPAAAHSSTRASTTSAW